MSRVGLRLGLESPNLKSANIKSVATRDSKSTRPNPPFVLGKFSAGRPYEINRGELLIPGNFPGILIEASGRGDPFLG